MSEDTLTASTVEEEMQAQAQIVTHYLLDDGRYWDLEHAIFTTVLSDTSVIGKVTDDQGHATITALKDCLRANNLDLGELAPTTQEEVRLLTLRDEKLEICKETFQPSTWMNLSAKMRNRWRAWYDALKHLPEQEGYPWDGGLEQTPWPPDPYDWLTTPAIIPTAEAFVATSSGSSV